MKLAKLTLLSATMLAGTFAGAAQAQVTNPGAELHGIGASSITTVLVQEMNCLSGHNDAGNNNGTSSVVNEGVYTAAVTTPLKNLNCDANGTAPNVDLQPNDSGKYVATGSGGGRKGWSQFADQLATGKNPFDLTNTDATWNHYHFTFTDGPISQTEQDTFRTSSNTNSLGNAIQIPVYVLPVAVAYWKAYGHNTSTGADYNFNVKSTFPGLADGGLRLSRSNYCKIFNGEITNWNDAALKTTNAGQSLMDLADPRGAAGWASEGVPIRLVGRSDNSGTTDVFTRHLAAVCTPHVALNKFDRAGGALPWHSVLNMVTVDSGTVYTGSHGSTFSNATNDAAHQSLSGAYFDKTSGTINTTLGTETPGKWMIANGASGVRDAIKLAADHVSGLDANILLNGKLGYNGADYVTPATNAVLASAALQVNGTGTAYAAPTAKNAGLALTGILPPQSATNGVYNTVTDARTVYNPFTASDEPVDRANALHWTAVLYSAKIGGVAQPTLAAPIKGYAITGTTMMLPYQCYASNSTRIAIANLIGLLTGKAPKQHTSVGYTFDPATFTNPSATAPGLNTKNGIAAMSAAWNTAIAETFLKKSTQISGANTLGQVTVAFDTVKKGYYTTAGTGGNAMYIQNKIPTSAATLATTASNPGCTVGAGA